MFVQSQSGHNKEVTLTDSYLLRLEQFNSLSTNVFGVLMSAFKERIKWSGKWGPKDTYLYCKLPLTCENQICLDNE